MFFVANIHVSLQSRTLCGASGAQLVARWKRRAEKRKVLIVATVIRKGYGKFFNRIIKNSEQ
jgi:hypothetical protein